MARRRRRKKNPKWVIPVVIVGAVAVLGTGIFYTVKKYRKPLPPIPPPSGGPSLSM